MSGLLAGPLLFGHVTGQEPDRPPDALPPLETRQEAPESASRVVGRLADEGSGAPIAGALVTLEPVGRRAVTDSAGAFALGDVPPGRYELRIRHIGYGASSLPVEVRSGMTTSLSLRLPPEAIALDPLEVRVEAGFRPRYLEERGYYERKERGWGAFFDPEDVERWSVGFAGGGAERFLGNLAFQAPSHSPLCSEQPVYVDGRRVPREQPVYIDGRRVPREDGNNLLEEMSASEIGAVELYTSSAGIPLFAFNDTTMACGALVIWTRRWRKPSRLEASRVELCEPGGDPGTVSVEGAVTDAYTEVRLPGARVEATLRPEGGSGRERRASTTADELGRYRLCDLPAGGPIGLRAAAAGREGPAVLLPMPGREPVAADPGGAPAAADSGREPAAAGSGRAAIVSHDLSVRISGPGRIVGRVTDRDAGRPVTAASVAVAGTDAWTETDGSGYFLLEGVAPGDHVIEVRHVGYGAVADSVSLPADRTVEVRVALSADPVELEPLVVTALRDRRLEARGFYDRRRWGERTGRGRFFTAEEIGHRGPLRISHLVADVPGIRLECRGSRGCAIRAARAPTCSHLTVYVDGVRMIGGDAGASPGRRGTVDELVGAADVAAVEVYPGPGSVPGEFSGPTGQCGAVAIWTK